MDLGEHAMKTLSSRESLLSVSAFWTVLLFFALAVNSTTASAQAVLFDFDSAPLQSSLPLDQTAAGITAHLSATGSGFSIQQANVLGFTPPGFAGLVIYPNAITLADLIVRFDQTLSEFSIMYSCNELGCDDAATMRVTAYMNGSYVGTNTRTATYPGTWPSDTLKCSFPQGFDSVVVHYDSPPPTCKDYGTEFMADNMRVTAWPAGGVSVEMGGLPKEFALDHAYPNPFNPSTTIKYQLPVRSRVSLDVYNVLGQIVATLASGIQAAGYKEVTWRASNVASGVYFYRLQATSISDPSSTFSGVKRVMLLR